MQVIAWSGKALDGLISRLISEGNQSGWQRGTGPTEAHSLFTDARLGAGFTVCAPYDILGQTLLYHCCLHAPLGYGAYALYYNLLTPRRTILRPGHLPRAVYVLCGGSVAYAYRNAGDADDFMIDAVIAGIGPAAPIGEDKGL
jgi:hypothetical protein